MKRVGAGIVVIVLATALVGACKRESTEHARDKAPVSLSFRKVLSVAPAPCDSSASGMRLIDVDGVQCFELSPDGLTTSQFTAKPAKVSSKVDDPDFSAVTLNFTRQSELDAFNALTKACFDRAASCPTGQLGVVYRGKVQSAPQVQEPQFAKDVTISGRSRDLQELLSNGHR